MKTETKAELVIVGSIITGTLIVAGANYIYGEWRHRKFMKKADELLEEMNKLENIKH